MRIGRVKCPGWTAPAVALDHGTLAQRGVGGTNDPAHGAQGSLHRLAGHQLRDALAGMGLPDLGTTTRHALLPGLLRAVLMSGRVPSDWRTYFDSKYNDPKAPKNYDMMGRPRVQDENGNWFTRSGKACCGCGRHRNMGPRDIQTSIPSSRPGMDTPSTKPKLGGLGDRRKMPVRKGWR